MTLLALVGFPRPLVCRYVPSRAQPLLTEDAMRLLARGTFRTFVLVAYVLALSVTGTQVMRIVGHAWNSLKPTLASASTTALLR